MSPRKTRKKPPARLEPVLEFRATGKQLIFRVHTGGCTEAEHFHLGVSRRDGHAELTLTRLVPDNCKGDFPEGIELSFSYKSAGLHEADEVRLLNPIR